MRILFITTNDYVPWGGSEELWSQTAERLASQGHKIFVSVPTFPRIHPRLLRLSSQGINVIERRPSPRLRRLANKLIGPKFVKTDPYEILLQIVEPDLIVISNGSVWPPISLAENLANSSFKYINIAQAAHIDFFHSDSSIKPLKLYAKNAAALAFVSEANKRLTELELAVKIEKSIIVRNPYNVGYDTIVDARQHKDGRPVAFASIGRLHLASKGHDILLETLARPEWRARHWLLDIYGEGPNRIAIKNLIKELGLEDRVTLKGHVSDVIDIWRHHDALLMPSRYEGLPLVVVECMLCARPIIATAVAGSEVIDDNQSGFIAVTPCVSSFSEALERAWSRKSDWQSIGALASVSIRRIVNADPIGEFVDVLNKALKGNLDLESNYDNL